MDKSLREYITESDAEYAVEIKAPFDLHTKGMLDGIRRALDKYDLRELEPGSRRAIEMAPKDFPGVVAAGVTSVTAVTGIRPKPSFVALEVALMTMIPNSLVSVTVDGDDVDEVPPYNEPRTLEHTTDLLHGLERQKGRDAITGAGLGDHDSDREVPDAQNLVGQKRVRAMMAELESTYEAAKRVSADLVKKFVMSHLDLKESTGVGRRKGYYVCEGDMAQPKVLEGPLATIPDGLELRHP